MDLRCTALTGNVVAACVLVQVDAALGIGTLLRNRLDFLRRQFLFIRHLALALAIVLGFRFLTLALAVLVAGHVLVHWDLAEHAVAGLAELASEDVAVIFGGVEIAVAAGSGWALSELFVALSEGFGRFVEPPENVSSGLPRQAKVISLLVNPRDEARVKLLDLCL